MALIAALSAIMIAAISSGTVHLRRQKKRDEALNDTLDVVKDQVKNDHKINLRHDLTAVTDLVGNVKDMLETVGGQVKGLHTTVNNMDTRLIETDRRAVKVGNQLSEHLLSVQKRDERITDLEDILLAKEPA